MLRAFSGHRRLDAISHQTRSIFGIPGRSRSQQIPLDEPMPLKFSIENAKREPTAIVSAAKVTKLGNGVRVVSTTSILPGASVGLMFAGGSRHSPKPGMPHILAGLALQSSSTRSEASSMRGIEELGGQFSAEANRDNIIIRADILPNDLSAAMEIITDVSRNGSFDAEEVSHRAESYRHQVEQVLSQNATLSMEDALHNAAFAGKGLGRPIHAWTSNEAKALSSATEVSAYHDATFRPESIVIVGAGVDHEDLVKKAEEFLGSFKAKGPAANPGVSPYVGAEYRNNAPSTDGFAHFGLGFACGGWQSNDVVPACALSMLMGGGGSFSAGGPGKGMYSRLYQRVLTGNPWVHSAQCLPALHADATLVSIHGFCDPLDAGNLAKVLIEEAKSMSANLTNEEVLRAKNQLKSSLYMNLENRHILFEDLGQQILNYGKRIEPEKLAAEIDSLTLKDIRSIAEKMLSKPATVVIKGDTAYQIPEQTVIVDQLKK